MSGDIYESAIHDYLDMLKSLFEVKPSNTGCLMVTPFQRPDGDNIEVEVIPDADGKVTLADKGDSLNFLFASGLDVEHEEFRETLSLIMSQYGTEMAGDEIRVSAKKDQLGKALYLLLNATVAVGHLVYRKQLVKVPEW